MKNKICVVFTGGTIGSSVKSGTVSLDSKSNSLLINKYIDSYGKKISFDELYPVSMLSENVQKTDLEKIVDCIEGIDFSAYDGIIVTHGTDTLCFSANYLSQVFYAISVPVVLVSANYPLEDERTNGLKNFAGAVTFIETADVKGVFVSFTNPGEECKIHLASRLVDAEQFSGNFSSLLSIEFGSVKDNRFIRNTDPRNPTAEQINAIESRPQLKKLKKLCEDIMVIDARALLNFDLFSFEKVRVKAVILNLYHSGTICTVGTHTNAVEFAKRCKNSSIEVVLSSVDSSANVYEGMSDTFKGCVKSFDTSHEMTAVKVMLALGEGLSIKEVLETDNFFEMLHTPVVNV